LAIVLASLPVKQLSILVPLFALVAASAGAGCSDSATEETTEMAFSQQVQVRFGSMDSNLPKFVSLALDNLGSVPDFETHRESFQCVVVDRQRTQVTITKLMGAETQTAVAITTSLRDLEDSSWVPLLSLGGFAEQTQHLMPGPEDVSALGEEALEIALLTQEPSLLLQIQAETADPLEALELELDLALFFSTESAACDERRGLPEDPHGESAGSESL
jgi:hypothetical protein